MTYVLDAFALLAYFKNELGAARMEDIFAEATETRQSLFLSVINLGEVSYKTRRQFGQRRVNEVLAEIKQLPITTIDVDEELALDAAAIKGEHRISYADCIAAALAQKLNATLVTGDRGFERIPDLTVEWLPQ